MQASKWDWSSRLTIYHRHEDHLVGKAVRDHGEEGDDPGDRRPRSPAQPEQSDDETRPANARQWQAEVLGVLVWVSPDEALGNAVVEEGEHVGDHGAAEHHHEGDTGFTSRETVDALEDFGEDL